MRKKVKTIINLILIIIIIVIGWSYYSTYNFSDYIKAEYNRGYTKFSRDKEVTYNQGSSSYKIENIDYNDAMFYKTVPVQPDMVYKVTCKVKTENVEVKEPNKDAGAHISINNTVEKSNNVVGTTDDWQELEFYFNSRNRTEVELGFRLGGYDSNCKGTAWFTDFTLESGIPNTDKNWKFLCLLMDSLDVTVEKEGRETPYKIAMTEQNKSDIIQAINQFSNSMQILSEGKMTASCDIFEVTEPITSLSCDTENGYYVAPSNMESILKQYDTLEKEYDHIFIVIQTGNNEQGDLIPVNNWIGLGGMEYRGKGFSNIRVPSKDNNYFYRYIEGLNTFPQEVLVHEFLHTLERNAQLYGYEIPALHDYEQYGYQEDKQEGQKAWYIDYMNCQIKTGQGYIGLPAEIYTKKPVHVSDFQYTVNMDDLKEPDNIFEELNNLLNRIIQMFSGSKQMTNTIKEVGT